MFAKFADGQDVRYETLVTHYINTLIDNAFEYCSHIEQEETGVSNCTTNNYPSPSTADQVTGSIRTEVYLKLRSNSFREEVMKQVKDFYIFITY